jgi:hypothetical protein
MRTALRTAVATALLAGLATGTVGLATATAYAAEQPVAAPAQPKAPAQPESPAQEQVPAPAEDTAPVKEAPVKTAPAKDVPAKDVPVKDAPAKAAEGDEDGTLVRTETLSDGTVAKIYKIAESWYRAKLFVRDASVGSVDANGRPAAGNNNGAFFVLNPDGTTASWVGNFLPGAGTGFYELADGTVVQVGKHPTDGRYGIQLIENGQGRGFTYSYHPVRSVYTFGKAIVVLENDGGLAAYISGGSTQAAPHRVRSLPGKVVTIGECAVRQDIPGWSAFTTVTLTNDLAKGPKAELKDDENGGRILAVVDRATPTHGIGITIKGADTTTAEFGQRSEPTRPYGWTPFPKLPKGCEKDGPTTAPSATTGTGTGTGTGNGVKTNTVQTSVIPRGGVAAGAEFGTAGDSSPVLVAAGAGASLAAAGLGFVVLRRRAAGARG